MSWVVEYLHANGSVRERVTLSGKALRIGRALDNDLVLDDPHCAAHHAVLRVDEQGQAQLHDLGTVNGICVDAGWRKPKRHSTYAVIDDSKIQLGASSIRVRHTDWPVAPETPFSSQRTWPAAAIALVVVVVYSIWRAWLGDVNETPPLYLSEIMSLIVVLVVWSTGYALLGRLLGGSDRFFKHLWIVCCAFLGGMLLHQLLEVVAFSFYWLWPLRIARYATVLVVALTIRAHMRIADPRHWPVLRWGVALGAALAIAVPLAQTWISSKRLTNIQLMNAIAHPSLRMAHPVPIAEFMETAAGLQSRADAQRKINRSGGEVDAEED
jgi:hypothetical protein